MDQESGTHAPQVCLDSRGELVVDKNSLVVTSDQPPKEVIVEDVGEFGIGTNYPKVRRTNSAKWVDAETELFYFLLSAVGSDFALMHHFFGSRSRDQLKQKFKKEEKANPERVDEVLANPSLLSKSEIAKTVKIHSSRIRAELVDRKSKRVNRKPKEVNCDE